jgi:hypothetical protein
MSAETPDERIPQDPGIPGWKPPPEGPERDQEPPPELPDAPHPDVDDEGRRS